MIFRRLNDPNVFQYFSTAAAAVTLIFVCNLKVSKITSHITRRRMCTNTWLLVGMLCTRYTQYSGRTPAPSLNPPPKKQNKKTSSTTRVRYVGTAAVQYHVSRLTAQVAKFCIYNLQPCHKLGMPKNQTLNNRQAFRNMNRRRFGRGGGLGPLFTCAASQCGNAILVHSISQAPMSK